MTLNIHIYFFTLLFSFFYIFRDFSEPNKTLITQHKIPNLDFLLTFPKPNKTLKTEHKIPNLDFWKGDKNKILTLLLHPMKPKP